MIDKLNGNYTETDDVTTVLINYWYYCFIILLMKVVELAVREEVWMLTKLVFHCFVCVCLLTISDISFGVCSCTNFERSDVQVTTISVYIVYVFVLMCECLVSHCAAWTELVKEEASCVHLYSSITRAARLPYTIVTL